MKKISKSDFNITTFECLDSTNNYLKQLLFRSKEPQLHIISTDFQTAGKGQRGNYWESEANQNLTFSFNIYPRHIPINKQFLISKVVSVALHNTLSLYIKTDRIKIKWPNDIYIDDKKIAGILIENSLLDDRIELCIIGIGINLNQTEFLSDAPNPTSLKLVLGVDIEKELFLKHFLEHFTILYNDLIDKKHSIDEEYHQSLYRYKQRHSFEDNEGIFKGSIQNVSQEGVITITKENNKSYTYLFKEVKYII